MAALLQVLMLMQVYLCAVGQNVECDLNNNCIALSLPAQMIDALSTDSSSEARFVCMIPLSPRGSINVTWWFNSDGVGDDDVAIPTSSVQGSRFFTSSGNILEVRNVGAEHEGLYKCLVTESEAMDQPTKQNLDCLFVVGQGVFASCPDSTPDCMPDETMPVLLGGVAELDARVTFRDGGPCANQGVRLMRVTRDSQQDPVYICSNLRGFEGPCNNILHPRFTIMNASNCTKDCKYNIKLQLPNFNESDFGAYTVTVMFESISGVTMQRTIQRTFRFTPSTGSSGTGTVSSTEPTTIVDSPPPTPASPQQNKTIIAAVVPVGVILLVVVAMVIIAVVLAIVYKKKRHKNKSPDADQTEKVELYNNSDVSARGNKRGDKCNSTLIEVPNFLSESINSPAANV